MNIGRYEVINELGRGGMAIVYLARDPSMKRQVAIKVLPRQFTFDPQFRDRFQLEAEVVATLEHDSIVPVYDFGEHEDQPFLVMRYMPGGTLSNRLDNGPLPTAEIQAVFSRIGAALDHAHRMGVIHRDIKPGNFLFDAQGNASLSDFGIAKISEATSAFTRTGGIVGTPAYMSPEQVQGDQNLDGRCDVYALGVVLFEALSGQAPFNADTPMGIAVAHVTEPVPSILERRPELPAAFETVIHKAMQKDPNRRYQTAGELAQAIEQAIDGTAASSGDRTVLEPQTATYVETAQATYVEPIGSGTTPPSPQVAGPQTASTAAVPPRTGSRSLPKWILAGGLGILTLCACAALIGVFASGILPNPLAGAPAATDASVLSDATPSETSEPADTPASSATAEPTEFIPVGLSTTYIEYILDASGSMLQTMQGKTRLQIAQEVLTARLNALPANTQVGLRVYGHRIPFQNREEESCQDIELVVPIRANGAESIIAWLPGMQALGMTPMSESIRRAANDFTFEAGRRNFIVLISDGQETCGEEPASVVQYLREIGIDFAIHVIGLDVDAQTAGQLSRIADVGGGVYYDARSQEDLDNALGNINDTILTSPDAPVATPAASPTRPATATLVPEPNAEITSEGTVQASSIFDANYPTSLATDGDPTTSWFSAGPEGDGTTTYLWTGVQDDFFGAIDIVSNRSHQIVDFRTGFGFADVTIQVLDSQGAVVFEQIVNLDGTPDPDVRVTPNVVGRSVRLTFTGSESLDCGGFSEIVISAVR